MDITLAGKPLEEVLEKQFTMAFNSYISLGAFGETWNGKPIGGGVAGEIPSVDVRGFDWNHTGLVYRNELIAAIRDLGVIGPDTGVALDGRLRVGSAT